MQSTIPGILIVINSFFYCIPAFFANINNHEQTEKLI